MNVETYKKRAAELREHMERPMAPFDPSAGFYRESPYLPGGEKKSMKLSAPSMEDWSHLNPESWKKHQRTGRKGKGMRKRR